MDGVIEIRKKIEEGEAPSPTVPPTADVSSALDQPWFSLSAAGAPGSQQSSELSASVLVQGGDWKRLKAAVNVPDCCRTRVNLGYA